MDIIAEKQSLLKWVEGLKDEKTILVLSLLKNSISSKASSDWWDEMSTEQKSAVEESAEDYLKGNVISSEEFWAQSNY